jgi:hypothetical protein
MAGHMKKKRCNHVKDEWMPVPEGYSRKDFLKKHKGGVDEFTRTRIKDFISYFCATNIPDNEAMFLIQKQFGVKLATPSYHALKREVMSNVEVQVWLNSYAKIGFVAAHIQDIERTKMMCDKIVAAYLTEMAKEHEERDYKLLSQLTRDYEKLTKLAIILRAGAPVLARIKAMIDASNIRAMENDPTMSEEEKKRILSRHGDKTVDVITVPNTLTDDDTDLTVVSRHQMNKHPEKEERGKAVKYNKQNKVELVKPEDLNSFEGENEQNLNIKSGSSESESGSEFISFLINESKSDDIIPKRLKSSLNLDSKG